MEIDFIKKLPISYWETHIFGDDINAFNSNRAIKSIWCKSPSDVSDGNQISYD